MATAFGTAPAATASSRTRSICAPSIFVLVVLIPRSRHLVDT
jgi:hypothetical protein